MKTRIILFALIGITISAQAANLWRVTSDKSLKPHFSNLQHAIDSCGVGDTIYVYPGNYGTVEVKKKVNIFGVGYFIAENAKDTLTSFVSTSHLDNITFSAGSDFSLISGLEVGSGINCNSANNITISGNKYGGISLTNSNYMIIKKNYGGGINGVNCLNTMISNNIMGGINFDISSNVFVQNNFMNAKISVYNSTLVNNIDVYNCNVYYDNYGHTYLDSHSLINSTIQYNISLNALFGTINGNFQVSPNLIFSSPIIADNYQLTVNSAAKGAGLGGVDCGPFGGDDPYCVSGLNYIPTEKSIAAP